MCLKETNNIFYKPAQFTHTQTLNTNILHFWQQYQQSTTNMHMLIVHKQPITSPTLSIIHQCFIKSNYYLLKSFKYFWTLHKQLLLLLIFYGSTSQASLKNINKHQPQILMHCQQRLDSLAAIPSYYSPLQRSNGWSRW